MYLLSMLKKRIIQNETNTWRHQRDSNSRIKVLQTSALPLGYGAKHPKIKKWWLEQESNQRHEDFQSSALPTELSSHEQKIGDPEGTRTLDPRRDRPIL